MSEHAETAVLSKLTPHQPPSCSLKLPWLTMKVLDSAGRARRCHAYPLTRLWSPDLEMVRVWLDGEERKGEMRGVGARALHEE